MYYVGKLNRTLPNSPKTSNVKVNIRDTNVHVDTIKNDNDVNQVDFDTDLLWVNIDLAGQQLPAMIDSGANPNCILLRCVQGSKVLESLPRNPYVGKCIVDANGRELQPQFVINCTMKFGTPVVAVECEFVVIKSLPLSCIIGQRTLRSFSSDHGKCLMSTEQS